MILYLEIKVRLFCERERLNSFERSKIPPVSHSELQDRIRLVIPEIYLYSAWSRTTFLPLGQC